jgi:hypothetical protein
MNAGTGGASGVFTRFQQFLKANNFGERIVWVMPEDVLIL